jgi:hypothetical protein
VEQSDHPCQRLRRSSDMDDECRHRRRHVLSSQ